MVAKCCDMLLKRMYFGFELRCTRVGIWMFCSVWLVLQLDIRRTRDFETVGKLQEGLFAALLP